MEFFVRVCLSVVVGGGIEFGGAGVEFWWWKCIFSVRCGVVCSVVCSVECSMHVLC